MAHTRSLFRSPPLFLRVFLFCFFSPVPHLAVRPLELVGAFPSPALLPSVRPSLSLICILLLLAVARTRAERVGQRGRNLAAGSKTGGCREEVYSRVARIETGQTGSVGRPASLSSSHPSVSLSLSRSLSRLLLFSPTVLCGFSYHFLPYGSRPCFSCN